MLRTVIIGTHCTLPNVVVFVLVYVKGILCISVEVNRFLKKQCDTIVLGVGHAAFQKIKAGVNKHVPVRHKCLLLV
jgi:hypothetical protein